MAFKVEITSTQFIKPSSSTPHHLKYFKLSLLDQIAPPFYFPTIFFYRKHPTKTNSIITHELKASLSQVLTQFYPLAGRINGSLAVVDCNDTGVSYSKAIVLCSSLSDILKKPDINIMDQLVPVLPFAADDESCDKIIPLLIQVSFFECGGMAIGIQAAHRTMDAATLSTFIREWANTSFGNQPVVVPDFTISSIFPSVDSLNSGTGIKMPEYDGRAILKRFVFDASSILALKSQLACPSVTRVQAISALIWKCAIKASKMITSNSNINLAISAHIVNMRTRFYPPLSENSFGNCVWVFWVKKNHEDDEEMELDALVDKLGHGLKEFLDGYMKQVQGSEGSNAVLESVEHAKAMMTMDGMEFYTFTSWCRFGFYEADFGWGKPEWISFPNSPFKNTANLMDTKGGDGVEVWVNLEQQHMAAFEKDQELLAFCSVDPSIS